MSQIFLQEIYRLLIYVFDLACYTTVAFARKYERLAVSDLAGMASLVAQQLSISLQASPSSENIDGISIRQPVSIPFWRKGLALDLNNKSLIEAHTDFARSRLPSLATVAPDDLPLDRLLRLSLNDAEPLYDKSFDDGSSLASREISTLDAQAFLGEGGNYGVLLANPQAFTNKRVRYTNIEGAVGLAGCRLTESDELWLLPGLVLALIARLSSPTSGKIVALAHLFACPTMSAAVREEPEPVFINHESAKNAKDGSSTREAGSKDILHLVFQPCCESVGLLLGTSRKDCHSTAEGESSYTGPGSFRTQQRLWNEHHIRRS